MLQKQKIDFVGFTTENPEDAEIRRKDNLTYLLLFFAINPDNGEEERRFEIIDGRFWVCDRIMNAQNQYDYGLVNIFKSQIISEKVKTFLTNSISFYTFLRYCIEKGVQVGDDGSGNYMDIDMLNDLVMNEYYDNMIEIGIYDEEDLDRYYRADFNHEDYVPDPEKRQYYMEGSMNE